LDGVVASNSNYSITPLLESDVLSRDRSECDSDSNKNKNKRKQKAEETRSSSHEARRRVKNKLLIITVIQPGARKDITVESHISNEG
jgi:hypothetical protein